jgi:hypothetical protein
MKANPFFQDLESADQIPVHTDDFRREYQRRLRIFARV